MELHGLDARATRSRAGRAPRPRPTPRADRRGRSRARARRGCTGSPSAGRRAQRACAAPRATQDHDEDDEQVRQHLEEERRRAVRRRTGSGCRRIGRPLEVEVEPADRGEQVGRRSRPGSGSTGRRSRGRSAIQPRPLTVWSPNQPGEIARVIVAPGEPGQHAAERRRRRSAGDRRSTPRASAAAGLSPTARRCRPGRVRSIQNQASGTSR